MPRLVCISDVHGEWDRLPPAPTGDILVVAGDFSEDGRRITVMEALQKISALDFKDTILIAGNHDRYIEAVGGAFRALDLPPGITYLEDSGAFVQGLNFWGSPWTLRFYNWAFMGSEPELGRKFAGIPADTDVLVTHGPPNAILDVNDDGEHCGSTALFTAVVAFGPRVHVFGHIHEDGGKNVIRGDTTFYNVAGLDEAYRVRPNPWTVIDIEPRESSPVEASEPLDDNF